MHRIGGAFSLCLIIHLTEGRVYCQDTHASPWIPLGYTCPVMCENILNAIERLKIMDYKRMLEEDTKDREKINESYMKSLINSVSREAASDKNLDNKVLYNKQHKKTWKHKNRNKDKSLRYQEYVKGLKKSQNEHKMDTQKNNYVDIDNNIESSAGTHDKVKSKQNGAFKKHKELITHKTKFKSDQNGNHYLDVEIKKEITETFAKMENREDDLERELKKAFENRTCDWFRSKEPYVMMKKIIRKCGEGSRRNGYGEEFLRSLTRTMNRFSKASFEFTEDMVELVLERVFGKNVELRKEVFDLGKLLHYLRNAMEMHKQHTERDTTIVLKPRHCLSLSMPGCFCRPGFVESSGQCVKPADCVSDSSNEDYLSRIVVH